MTQQQRRDWVEEMKCDAASDARREDSHEREMHNNIDYCIEHCGLDETGEEINDLLNKFIVAVEEYGWTITRKEVLGLI